MKQLEYSPPSAPTIDQHRDALQKGLGRAVQWAKAGKLADEPLLAACLKEQRYDTQVEDSRGDWLWGIIQEVGAVDRFRVPILHALYNLDDSRSASQLVDFAFRYAETGDETFHARLSEIVEAASVPQMAAFVADAAILQLDGRDGFLRIAKLRGKELSNKEMSNKEWEWYPGALVDCAVEQLGEAEAIRCLEETEDLDLIRFLETWREQSKVDYGDGSSYRDEIRAITVSDILSAAQSDKDRVSRFRVWGSSADEADLETVLETIWRTTDPGVIANLLQVFFQRSLTTIDPRWFELCRHSDHVVRWRAFVVLEKNAHPLVREFALAELGAPPLHPQAVGLFIKNYQKGDESKILDAIDLADYDEYAIHSLLMDVIKVLETNKDADCLPLALLTYASTPCENCRHRAVQLLLGDGVAPGWMIEECRFDACSQIREEIERTDD